MGSKILIFKLQNQARLNYTIDVYENLPLANGQLLYQKKRSKSWAQEIDPGLKWL